MMLIASASFVYMIDRDNAVYSVPKIFFPKRKDPSASIADTLLDGVSSTYSNLYSPKGNETVI